MHSTVRARTTMHLAVSNELSFRTAVDLDYDTGDPFAVRFTFHLPGDDPVTWVFARDLLAAGTRRPAGEGDVHVRPVGDGLAEVCLVLRSPGGDALLRAAAPPLLAFLARTDRLVPFGRERFTADLDRKLAAILSTAGPESAS
ncbi:SsgA family sporulation/cell division regulator [Kitasatospora phosalacinea]|uniref:SsgA family sporulation/cell division regulator n=1 Tax=Kitasatospora phosalacinea TaxID=2065 RepID=UPI0035D5EEE6